LDRLGYKELVIYDSQGRPDNIDYRLLSVALLRIIKDLNNPTYDTTGESPKDIINVTDKDYTINGEDLLVTTKSCNIKLDSIKNKKIKIKSLSSVTIYPDLGMIDNKWESIDLRGDSCVEFIFISELGYWVITSSDGIKDS
jgi:hypothetical protein